MLDNKDEAKKYIEKLRILDIETEENSTPWYKFIKAQYKLSESFLLIRNGNFRDIAKAKELLSYVIEMPVKFELIADSLLSLIEIVIQEYKLFQNISSLEEINKLSEKIDFLAEKNNSIILKINLFVLRGKIEFINGKLTKSEEFYIKALKLAEEYNQQELIKQVKKEIMLIIDNFKNAVNSVLSTSKERFDAVEIENYVKEAFKILKKGI